MSLPTAAVYDAKDLKDNKGKEVKLSANDKLEAFLKLKPTPITKEDTELLNLKEQYGDFMVIMVECYSPIESGDNKGFCKPEWTGRLSPIEMALVPPFNQSSSLKEVKISDIKDKVLQPLLIPERNMQDNKEPTILVAYMKSPDAFTIRANYLATHNPVASLLENLMLPLNKKVIFKNYKAQVNNILSEYRSNSQIVRNILVNGEYSDAQNMFNSDKLEIASAMTAKLATASLNELYDMFNNYIAVTSSYKLITPKAVESSFDYYALRILLNSSEGIDLGRDIKYSFFSLPGLVEYFKQIALLNETNLDSNGIDLLRMESFRIATTSQADIPKDYFTIFTPQEIKTAFYREQPSDSKRVDEFMELFTSGVHRALDLSKTCLTGSAIAFTLYCSKVFNKIKERKDYIDDAQRTLRLYSAINITPRIRESKGRILDLSRKVILDPLKTVEAVFSFGADIDLAVLVTDFKQFDAIALQHYEVCAKKWPGVQMFKNIRNEGYTYSIVSTLLDDYLLKGFRVIEIYRGTIAKILSHHIPAVRGWYDQTGIHLDITALEFRSDNNKLQYDNYYYFASSKSTPSEIITKYYRRQFVPRLKFYPNTTKNQYALDKQLTDGLIATAEAIEARNLKSLLQVYNLDKKGDIKSPRARAVPVINPNDLNAQDREGYRRLRQLVVRGNNSLRQGIQASQQEINARAQLADFNRVHGIPVRYNLAGPSDESDLIYAARIRLAQGQVITAEQQALLTRQDELAAERQARQVLFRQQREARLAAIVAARAQLAAGQAISAAQQALITDADLLEAERLARIRNRRQQARAPVNNAAAAQAIFAPGEAEIELAMATAAAGRGISEEIANILDAIYGDREALQVAVARRAEQVAYARQQLAIGEVITAEQAALIRADGNARGAQE